MIEMLAIIYPFNRIHIVRNKMEETINNKFFPFVKVHYLYKSLTLLPLFVKKESYQATDALDLLQITRISADGNQFGFAQYGFKAIVRPKL